MEHMRVKSLASFNHLWQIAIFHHTIENRDYLMIRWYDGRITTVYYENSIVM